MEFKKKGKKCFFREICLNCKFYHYLRKIGLNDSSFEKKQNKQLPTIANTP